MSLQTFDISNDRLKYQRSSTSGCKDIWMKNQSLWQNSVSLLENNLEQIIEIKLCKILKFIKN